MMMDSGNLRLRARHPQSHQGVCADAIATMEGITRLATEELAVESQKRADNAIKNGYFEKSLVPVYKEDGALALDREEFPRPQTTLEGLASLKPSFEAFATFPLNDEGLTFGGLIKQAYPDLEIVHIHHAGNSSGVVDGSAALLLSSEAGLKANGWKPRAKVVAMANMGDSPELMLNAPVPAAKKVLEKAGLTKEDIDLWEINEAFAMVTMLAINEMGLNKDKVNVHGGACALGHPIGASGARILTTLIHALRNQGKQRGVASLCIGGGEAVALAVEAL